MTKKSKDRDEVVLNSYVIPRAVFEEALELSLSGEKIGIWKAKEENMGTYGFIVGPISKIKEVNDRFKILGYKNDRSEGAEYIPEPIYVHGSNVNKNFNNYSPVEDEERSNYIQKRMVNIPREPAVTNMSMGKFNLFIKKSEWERIGKKTGWNKILEKTYDFNINKKAMMSTVAKGLKWILPTIGITLGVEWMNNFFGSEEEAKRDLGLSDAASDDQQKNQEDRNRVLLRMRMYKQELQKIITEIDKKIEDLNTQMKNLQGAGKLPVGECGKGNYACGSLKLANLDIDKLSFDKFNIQYKAHIQIIDSQINSQPIQNYCNYIHELLMFRKRAECLIGDIENNEISRRININNSRENLLYRIKEPGASLRPL